MGLFPRFIRRLDATAPRAIIVSLLLLAGVVALFVIGKIGGVMDVEGLRTDLRALAEGPWGLPALIVLFCISAYVGVPQFVLIGMAVFAFGPWVGVGFGWLATLVSGTLTFWTGRLAGEGAMRRHGGNFANRLSAFIGRNAFTASTIVRIVPTGPFLLVNMAFGVSQARFSHFLAGLALGALPKLTLVAFAGSSVLAAFGGRPVAAVLAASLAACVWAVLVFFARRYMRSERQNLLPGRPEMVDTPGRSDKA